MAVIDHLVYAVPDLADGIAHFESILGVRAAMGGSHPGKGTHNALLSFGTSYLEIIAPDPDQPEPAEPRPFGVTVGMEPSLVTYAVRPAPGETLESLVERSTAAGHDPGPIASMSRAAPDGSELTWRLTFPTMAASGFVPFLIDWGDTRHPSESAPAGGQLLDLTGSIPDADRANALNAALGVEVTASTGDAGLTALIRTISDESITL